MPLLLKKCESGGTGRRARLRGVWIHRTGSSPVSRTKDRFERNGPFFFALQEIDRIDLAVFLFNCRETAIGAINGDSFETR